MKKNLAAMAVSLLLLGFSRTTSVNGQDYANREAKGKNPFSLTTLTIPEPAASPVIAKSVTFLDPKMFKKFNNQFPEAKDAVWYRDGNRTHFYFHGDGEIVRAAMKENGQLIHTIRYYSPDRLPLDVAATIHSSYKGYKMSSVTEVNIDDKTAYIVVILGMEDWLQVKYLDGEVTEFASFTY
jgi:hypothetical protein